MSQPKAPSVLRGTVGKYIMMKLAAAGATYVSVALFFGLLGFLGGPISAIYVFAMSALLSMNVLYTYGIAYSLLADWILKLTKMDNVYLGAITYGIGGVLFPFVWAWGDPSAPPFFFVMGILCSLGFFGLQRAVRPEHRHGSRVVIAISTVIPAVLVQSAYGIPLFGLFGWH